MKEVDLHGKQRCEACGELTERISHYELDHNIYEFYLCDKCNNSNVGNLLKELLILSDSSHRNEVEVINDDSEFFTPSTLLS